MDWAKLWADIKNFFIGNVWTIIGFFAVLLIGIIVVKLFIRILRKIFNAKNMEKIAQNFILAIIRFLLYFVLVIILLSIIGIEISGIITALSAALLAVGLALESSIANLANGIIIVSSKMFKKGDYIEVAGVSGSVQEIHFLFSTIITPDNKKITLPNSTIVNNAVVNSGANKTRRVDFIFSAAYESDVDEVKRIILAVFESNGKVYLDPAPFCRLKVLNESSIDFAANCWVDSEDYWDVYYYVIENVYNEFKRKGISVPYKQVEIRSREDVVTPPVIGEGLPERVEKVRVEEEEEFDLETDSLREYIDKKKAKREKKKNKKK